MKAGTLWDPSTINRHIHRTPPDFGTLSLWYKADAIVGAVDGGPVGGPGIPWPDSSGGGRDATSGFVSGRPTYRLNQYNGLPAVEFDGVLNSLSFTSLPFTGTDSFTIAILFQALSAKDAMLLGNAANVQVRHNRALGDVISFFPGSCGEIFSPVDFPGSPLTLRVHWWRINYNGVDRRTGNFYWTSGRKYAGPSDSFCLTAFDLSRISGNFTAGQEAHGKYAEICVWTGALSKEQIYDLTQHYFKPKWGLFL